MMTNQVMLGEDASDEEAVDTAIETMFEEENIHGQITDICREVRLSLVLIIRLFSKVRSWFHFGKRENSRYHRTIRRIYAVNGF